MTILERNFNLRISAANLRTMMFDEREHLVVPVVMLVEGVLQAVNAPVPEFVPAEVFSAVPQGWDGRPAVGGHPTEGTRQVSANSPRVLEENKIGTLFHTNSTDNKLKTEAWIDPTRCKPGTIGERVLTRLREGETVEVSVGVFVALEKRSGSFGGKKFEAVWTDMVPDHLAFLPEGQEGACSVEAGCGAPRAARAYQLTAAGAFEEVSMAEPKSKWQTLRERLAAGLMKIRGAADQSMSDQDLRDKLYAALFAEEAGFLGIDAVFPSESLVVYATQPETELKLWRRGFTSDGAAVTLAGDKEEVQLETSYVPVNAAAAAPCPCGGKPTDASSREQEGERNMAQKTKAERVKALIESKTHPWAESDRAFLESLPEDRLASFEAPLPATTETGGETTGTTPNPPASAAPVAAPPAPVAAPEPVTAEAYVASAPPEVREFLQSGLRAAQAQKLATITALKATNRCSFTDAQLNAMSQEQLGQLLTLAGATAPAVDFAGRGGVARDAAQITDAETVPPPPSLTSQIRANRGLKAN